MIMVKNLKNSEFATELMSPLKASNAALFVCQRTIKGNSKKMCCLCTQVCFYLSVKVDNGLDLG
jgi:hypothetical protein